MRNVLKTIKHFAKVIWHDGFLLWRWDIVIDEIHFWRDEKGRDNL